MTTVPTPSAHPRTRSPLAWARLMEQHAGLSTQDLLYLILFYQLEEIDRMGALEDALANEEAVIAQVVVLVQSFGTFQAQLDAANQALADLQVVDQADKANLQAALDAATTAAGTVSSQTAELQALVTPAAPAPVEPPPVP